MNRLAKWLFIVTANLNGFGLANADESPKSPNFPAMHVAHNMFILIFKRKGAEFAEM